MTEIIGLLISLSLFVFLSFKGWNIAAAAISASALLIITNGIDIIDGFFNIFSSGFGNFASSWWGMFTAGALFGKAIQDSGASGAIVKLLMKRLKGNSLMIILLISLIMSYGGISTFVIAFTMYPIAAALFRKEKINNCLLPATILFCPTTLSMTMLPGTPSIQNVIPTDFLDTTIYAAPILGIIASAITFTLGYIYLKAMTSRLKTDASDDTVEEARAADIRGVIPCIVLWIVSFVLVNLGVNNSASITVAMLAGTAVCFIFPCKKCNVKNIVNQGILNGLKTVAMTSCIMGYGALVKSTDAFNNITDLLFANSDNFILSSISAINVIAMITGSSAGSLQMYFELFANQISAASYSHATLHRVIAVASGGLDSMPYATGVAVANELAGTRQSKTYIHVFVCCVIIPLISLAAIVFLGSLGIC